MRREMNVVAVRSRAENLAVHLPESALYRRGPGPRPVMARCTTRTSHCHPVGHSHAPFVVCGGVGMSVGAALQGMGAGDTVSSA